jgi:Zn finger protein HypA/HybF involved in hydrogenase expression
MFPIVINDGNTPMPNSDVYYVVGKEGIFIKKKLGIMESLSPVKNISILQSVEATARMHIPKIPAIITAKIANFFTDVYNEHSSEAVVLLFYNEDHKHYKIVVPPQEVSGAAAEYNRAITVEGYTMIGTIHSHANFTAFHSGTDQGDEQSFDGLHITFGNNQQDPISISASIVANGHRTMVDPTDYLDGVSLDYEVDEVEKVPTTRVYKWDPTQQKMVEDTTRYETTSYRTYRRYDKRYNIVRRNNKKAATPKSWLANVEKKTYTYYTGYQGAGMGWWQGWRAGGYWKDGKYHPPGQENNKWGGHFDSSVWKRNSSYRAPGHVAKTVQDEVKKTQPPQNVGVKVEPIKFPPHDQKQTNGVVTDITPPETPLPCNTCAFKNRAFAFITAELEKKYKSLLEDDDNEEKYYCEKCNVFVTFEYNEDDETIGEMVCPSCKSDDHLAQLIDDEDAIDVDEPMVFKHWDDYGDDIDTTEKKNMIECKSCKTKCDISMLKDDNGGKSCPTCGTLLILNENLNYLGTGNNLECKTCSSEFTYDLVKNDKCPFCKEPLVDIEGGKELLGEDTEEVNRMAMKEINDQKNPALMIPQPKEKQGVFNFMSKFLRRD